MDKKEEGSEFATRSGKRVYEKGQKVSNMEDEKCKRYLAWH